MRSVGFVLAATGLFVAVLLAAEPAEAWHEPMSGVVRPMLAPAATVAPSAFDTGWHAPLAGQIWLAAAVVFFLAIMRMPGAMVGLWFFGLAGLVVGGMSLMIDLTWQYQVTLFALVGVMLVVLWARFDRSYGSGDLGAGPQINGRGPGAMVGRVLRLEKPIEDGAGMVSADGTAWRVTGRDCAAGRRVKVLRAEGTLLVVDLVEC